MDDDLLSTVQAAAYLGLTRQRVDQLGAEGAIPRRRIGVQWVYKPADLDAWARLPKLKEGRPRKAARTVPGDADGSSQT